MVRAMTRKLKKMNTITMSSGLLKMDAIAPSTSVGVANYCLQGQVLKSQSQRRFAHGYSFVIIPWAKKKPLIARAPLGLYGLEVPVVVTSSDTVRKDSTRRSDKIKFIVLCA